ncbi:MAG: YvcK family protein [Chloroflexi bacterium]|nr:YvcK family protein [Chloroflexota bacterium]
MTSEPSVFSGAWEWLAPGVGVKRWALLGGAGVAMALYGLLILLPLPGVFPWETLAPVAGAGGLLLGGLGAVVASRGLYRALGSVRAHAGEPESLPRALRRRRRLARGPRVVVLGGGTGLSTLLRGLREYTSNLTAVVTVADDGGSSGRLRQELGIPPPGDFRNCLVALSEAGPELAEVFQYRFGQGSGLEGHSLGNLLIAALTRLTGSFEVALHEAERLLGVRGRVLPCTLADVRLQARTVDNEVVNGEASIQARGRPIQRVCLEPPDPPAYPEALRAIAEAQLLVVGPGSLYTSILPVLLVAGMAEAIQASPAVKVYVCNVATQRGETEGYSVDDHLRSIRRHVGDTPVDWVLVNRRLMPLDPRLGAEAVVLGTPGPRCRVQVVEADVVDEDAPTHHHSGKLAAALMKLYNENKTRRARERSYDASRSRSQAPAGQPLGSEASRCRPT